MFPASGADPSLEVERQNRFAALRVTSRVDGRAAGGHKLLTVTLLPRVVIFTIILWRRCLVVVVHGCCKI